MVRCRRDWVSSHHDVMQRYIDAIAETMVKVRQDKPLAISVLKKYFKSNDDALFGRIYDYYVRDGIWPAVPAATPELFNDAKDVIGKTNATMRDYDLTKLIDPSFVKSAADRGLTK